jgi:hypothetical protein
MNKAFVIPLIAILTFAIGTACLMLPFLPFGWALYALTALILMPYIKPLRKVFMWVADKDRTDTVVKIGYKIAALYRWSNKTKLANEVIATVKEAEESKTEEEDNENAQKKPAAGEAAGQV